jgi:hypothetical protein
MTSEERVMQEQEALDAGIDDWVSTQLAASPDWGDDKWTALGEILDVRFAPVRN